MQWGNPALMRQILVILGHPLRRLRSGGRELAPRDAREPDEALAVVVGLVPSLGGWRRPRRRRPVRRRRPFFVVERSASTPDKRTRRDAAHRSRVLCVMNQPEGRRPVRHTPPAPPWAAFGESKRRSSASLSFASDEGRSEEREQERRPPGRNDRDERRKQWALVPVVDQGELPPTSYVWMLAMALFSCQSR